MSFTPTTRKNSNSILFTFDSLVDFKLGVVNYLRKHVDGFDPQYMDKRFLESDNEDHLKDARMNRMDLDPIKMCFRGKAKDSSTELSLQIMEEYYPEVLELSPETNMVRLINVYNMFKIVKTTVACFTNQEEDWVREKFNDTVYIKRVKSYGEIDISKYARVVVSNINDLLTFKKVFMRHLCILNYTENFMMGENPTTHEEEKMLLPNVALVLSDDNVIEIMDPYGIRKQMEEV